MGSPTIASLADAIERSDVIVHIEERWWPVPGLLGETRFVTHTGGQRYLRISVDARVRGDAVIVLLAHELQHAWEIADARWVVDETTMKRLFDSIGHASRHGHGRVRADTPAGRETARRVSFELRTSGGRTRR